MSTSLYQITNEINKKIYIGITDKAPEFRLKQHSKVGSTTYISRSISKNGLENFTIKTLCIGDRDYILDLESKMISKVNSRDNKVGYNIAPGGEGVGTGEDNPRYNSKIFRFYHHKHGVEELTQLDMIKKYNLDDSIYSVAHGKIKSTRGWTLYKNRDTSRELERQFYHPVHGTLFCKPSYLIDTYDLDPKGIGQMIRRKITTLNNWRIV